MKRRGALKTISVVAGTGLLLPTFGGCKSDQYMPQFFSAKDLRLINDISETILPRTADAPGAMDCLVGNFVDTYISDCYATVHQDIVREGLLKFKDQCQSRFKDSFIPLPKASKEDFLIDLDTEAKSGGHDHYFGLLKNTIVFAYFTSKDGVENALDYLPIPGKYIGDYPLTSTQRTWAS